MLLCVILQVLNRTKTARAIPNDKLLTKTRCTNGAVRKNSNGNSTELLPVIGCDNHVALGSAQPICFTAVRRLIAEFIRSGSHDDLVFSAELTSEEREMIITEASKNLLQSRCYYRADDIYVAVSMQQKPLEIVNYLLENAGESNKYRLVEPRHVQS